jgi:hypothetical protein
LQVSESSNKRFQKISIFAFLKVVYGITPVTQTMQFFLNNDSGMSEIASRCEGSVTLGGFSA